MQPDDKFKKINLRNVCLIDNGEERFNLSDVLKKIVTEYYPEYDLNEQSGEQQEKKCLSIAVGYIDLPGIELLFKFIKNFDKIRILIGRDPEPTEIQKEVGRGFHAGNTREELKEEIEKLPDPIFADYTLSNDLEELAKEIDEFDDNPDKAKIKYFKLIEGLLMLIGAGKLELKIYDKLFGTERLHAKAFIFGYDDSVVKKVAENQINVADMILNDKKSPAGKILKQKQLDKVEDNRLILQEFAGIEVPEYPASTDAFATMGSSNFTRAGLKTSKELNTFLDTTQFITGLRGNSKHSLSYLEWFEEMWTHLGNEDWSGEFSEVVRESKLYKDGEKANTEQEPEKDLFPTKKDAYIKALLEAYPEVKASREKLDFNGSWFYDFQKESVGRLRYRLKEKKLAILADSVGLGKTITAGGVIVKALNEGKSVCIIAPSGLTNQWIDELSETNKFGLKISSANVPEVCKKNLNLIKPTSLDSKKCQDVMILSMENMNEIKKAKESSKNYDLFVIDEVHKLKSEQGARMKNIRSLLRKNKQSETLMLTATPLSNTLNDFISYLKLGRKNDAAIVNVTVDSNPMNFQLFLKKIMKEVSDVRKENKKQDALDESLEKKKTVDWAKYEAPLKEGFMAYMVRNTRQEIEANEEYKKSGLKFPKDHLGRIKYDFTAEENNDVKDLVAENKAVLESVDLESVSLGGLAAATKRLKHPITLIKQDEIEDKPLPGEDQDEDYTDDSFTEIFKLILLLGFVPYRTSLYRKDIYNSNSEQLSALLETDSKLSHKVKTQASIHNILRVNYLKRAESSLGALSKTLEHYKGKIAELEKAIKMDKVPISSTDKLQADVSLDAADDEVIDNEEGKDSLTYEDISNYEKQDLVDDISRDKNLITLLEKIIALLEKEDDKVKALVEFLTQIKKDDPIAKVLVFSEYRDTITYLNELIGNHIHFESGRKKIWANINYVLGGDVDIEEKVALFSPVSKGYTEKYREENSQHEIVKLLANNDKHTDILLATDALSEGQNLQDANYIVNFDVPWNPIRIVQRNGRINRLQSDHKDIYIYLMKPEGSYKLFLRLMDVVGSKIDMLTNTGLADVNITEEGQISKTTWQMFEDEATEIADVDNATEEIQKTNHYAYLEKYLNENKDDKVLERLLSIKSGTWFNTADMHSRETLVLFQNHWESEYGKFNNSSGGGSYSKLLREEFLDLVQSNDDSTSGLSIKPVAERQVLEKEIKNGAAAKRIAHKEQMENWNATEAGKIEKLVKSMKGFAMKDFRNLPNISYYAEDIREILAQIAKGGEPTERQKDNFVELIEDMKSEAENINLENTTENNGGYYYVAE
ncbi:MAG: SNF2-related protein [Micrococcaceae bacterium]